jgi:hypothetical protein
MVICAVPVREWNDGDLRSSGQGMRKRVRFNLSAYGNEHDPSEIMVADEQMQAHSGCRCRITPQRGEKAMSDKHTGGCFCGAVEIEVTGTPEGMGYCHCASCRSWSAGPVNAFTLWKPENVQVRTGGEFIGHYQKTENSDRQFCRKCGGHLMSHHPGLGLTDVYAATIPTFEFKPGVHVNYAETVLPMKDGLPKLKDFPAELGGSGIVVAE